MCEIHEIELMGNSLFRWGGENGLIVTGWGLLAVLLAVSLLTTLIHGHH